MLGYSSIVRSHISTRAFVAIMFVLAFRPALSQRFTRIDREQAETMLDHVSADIRNHYYDPKLHGIDFDTKVREARERIAQAPSYDAASTYIAGLFEALDDSHTFYIPPGHFTKEEYGWRFEIIGNRCLVTHVKPRSDAEAKGVKPGDQVLTIDGFTPSGDSLPRMEYVLNALMPMRSLTVDLLEPSCKVLKLEIMAQRKTGKQLTDSQDLTGGEQWMSRLEQERQRHLVRIRYKDMGPKLLIVKLPEFVEPEFEVSEVLGKARKHQSLILDLRGSPGGAEETLQYLLGGLFASDVKIADKVTRNASKPLMTKGSHRDMFSGNLFVLVDSQSASASELFARTVQIQKRGTVIGDHTAGAAMEAEHYFHKTGVNPVFYYGASITEADLILPDGKSLERNGVTPDLTILPSADDLSNDRDPAMARAAALAGIELSAADAGKFFPYEWPSN
jgi:C-terminal processing protease CtpA/Prc